MEQSGSGASTKAVDEIQQQNQVRAQQHERHEVVPSSETSIDDNDYDNNESKTTINVRSPSGVYATGQNQLKRDFIGKIGDSTAAHESDGQKTSESDTESESRLVIKSDNETNDTEIAAAAVAVKENGGTSASKSANKRKLSESRHNSDFSDDDEESFAGFSVDDLNQTKHRVPYPLVKRLKINSTHDAVKASASHQSVKATPTKASPIQDKSTRHSAHVALNDDINKSPGAVTTKTPLSSPVAVAASPAQTPKMDKEKPAHFITTDPRYRNPFKFGWRREVVFRANIENKQKLENKGEVYYHSPSGKKLRTKAEIMAELKKDQNLDIGDFTFAKESIGMPPDLEIVRSAKIQTPAQRRQPYPEPQVQTPDVLGKRIPKPKMPKGASPPPPSTSISKSRLSLGNSKRPAEVVEVIQPKVAKSGSKEACTINCVLAMGIIPQLQCKKCHSMYHHECAGRDGSRHFGSFICEHCVREKAEKSENAQNTQAAAMASAPQMEISQNNTANEVNGTVEQISRQKLSGTPAKKSSAAPVPAKSNSSSTTKKRSGKEDAASNATPNISDNSMSSSPPQTVAIVSGRKYIMVSKTNKLNISPPTGLDNINGVTATKSSSRPITPVAATKTSRSGSTSVSRASPSLPITSNAYASAPASVHSLFAANFFSNVSMGYDILFQVFQYLKIQELVRASSVCRMWNHVANNSIFWKTVRMKNSQATDWAGLLATLRRRGTRHLDLRKILIPSTLDWNDFINHIDRVPDLERVDLCRCPAEVVTALLETNAGLHTINALSITGGAISLPTICKLKDLTELRLKSGTPIAIQNGQALKYLTKLRHLSLTSIKEMEPTDLLGLAALNELESLELGECNYLSSAFAKQILVKLTKLERLRLERGQERCSTFDILDAVSKLPKLGQLELVNFDIKPGFETRIGQCKRLRRLLLIPTYISQSATTNQIVLASIAQLGNTLQLMTWVVTQELIRVTDLYTDDHGEGQQRRPSEDKIPVIKPVPMMQDPTKSTNSDVSAQLVEILPLSQVQKMIKENIPKMQLRILKVPYSATWRQIIIDKQP